MKTAIQSEVWSRAKKVACSGYLLLAMASLLGCRMPGKPEEGPEVPRPEQVVTFDQLYSTNCAGCHGAHGEKGAAMNLANPQYQAIVDDATLTDIITNGEKGTLMPAFGAKQGGELTEQQVAVLVKGMREKWNPGNVKPSADTPPWKATHAGNPENGKLVYAASCARCHGATAEQPGKAGSILDGSFLAVVNEQMIRTTVIAGRPDLKMPSWRTLKQGGPLSDDEVTDVTAWLMSQKPALPGQPYSNTVQGTTTKSPAGSQEKE